MAVLVKVNSNAQDQIVELSRGSTVLGRLPECDVVLDLVGVSRKHAEIRRDGEKFSIIDLKSRNKTYVNEREVPSDREQPLRAGDRVLICDVEMVFYPVLPPELAPDSPDQVLLTEGTGQSTLHTLDASRSSFQSSTVMPEAKLKAILDITRNLSSTLDLDTLAPKILDSLLEIFPQAERGLLVRLKEGELRPVITQAFARARPYKRNGVRGPIGRPQGDEARLSMSTTILGMVLSQKTAVLSQDAGNDTNLPTSASIADLRIRSLMCAPLLTTDGLVLGVIQLDTTDRRQFKQEDLDVLVAVAGQAAFAVHNATLHASLVARERIVRDLSLAEQVQRRFLPQTVPTVPGYEFFAYYQAAYEVGGDYYDFVTLSDNRVAIALGDVSGKGVTAALMMAKFSGDTRYCMLTENAPGPAADALNSLLYQAGFDEKFITLCLGVLETTTRRFTFASAGHLPIYIRRPSGEVIEAGTEIRDFPLGILPTSHYKQSVIDLEPGDVVVLYSDGVTDGRNVKDELYDTIETPRLKARVAASPGGAEAVGRSIVQHVREFSAGQAQADDITLVCFGPK
jgi:serine phosphatase RsbU (regulator of sigma subunit)/pSer/pThr/pTyr-binding forkhead associated (FHA) protein